MKSQATIRQLAHASLLTLAMFLTGSGIAKAAETPESGVRLDFSAAGMSIRMPTNKVTWAVTNALPARAAVLRRARYTNPPFAARELLAAIGVSDTGKFEPMLGQSEWQTPAGTHRVGYDLADGDFYYSFANAGPEWSQPEPAEFNVIEDRLVGFLVRSGFPTNELVRTPSGQFRGYRSEGKTSGWNPEKSARFTTVSSRSVDFSRQIGDIPMLGIDSEAQLEYRNDSIQSLRIHWPAMVIGEERPVAGKDQILQWLAEGRCVIVDVETTGGRLVEITEIQAIKITSTSMQYWRDWGAHDDQQTGQPSFPMLFLDVQVTLGPNDVETTTVLCPAIDVGLPPKQPSDLRPFNIFPSKKFPLPGDF